MEHRPRRAFWRELIGRLCREAGGASAVDFTIGAALAVGTVAILAGGVESSFGAMTRRTSTALGAPAAAASDPAFNAASKRETLIDRLEEQEEKAKELKEAAEEAAEQAADEGGFWSVLGTIFLGPVVGTAVGSAIGEPSGPSHAEEPAAADEERASLRLEAVPGWSRGDDD